jgi:hypothetical protein
MNSGKWGNDAASVVLAPKQFEAWSDHADQLRSIPQNSAQYQRALEIARQAASGQTEDPTGGAMNFANVDTVQRRGNQSAMGWINGMTNVTKIGDHTFGNAAGSPPASNTQPPQMSDADIIQQYLKPGADVPAPPAAAVAAPAEPADIAQIYLKPENKGNTPAPGSAVGEFGKGTAYGALKSISDILSAGGQAAAIEQNMEGVPSGADTFGILQKEVTGNLTPGSGTAGQFGRNVGAAAPYMLTMPSVQGILPRLVQAGLIGAGQTAGQKAAEGTPYEGAAGALGAIAAPSAVPFMARKVLSGAGGLLTNLAGGFSGVGPIPVTKAFQSGAQGGDVGQAFRSAIAGKIAPDQIVDQANDALTNLKLARGTQYLDNMKTVSESQTPLSFDGIDKAMAKANGIKSFKGQSLSPETQDVQDQVNSAINDWKSLDPAEYHTPIGMDALKQRIGSIKDNLPFGSPQRKVAEDAYNAVRGTITKQAPQYADAMKDYEDASNQIDEIKKTLSLNPNASTDTAFRKLLSTMRSNANTNYGQRAGLVHQLEENGAPTLSSSLAGQSMQSWLPHGLARVAPAIELPLAAYSAYQTGGVKGLAAMAAAAPLQSPRIVGNAAHALGRLYGASPTMIGTPEPLAMLLGMAKRPSQLQELLNSNVLPSPSAAY